MNLMELVGVRVEIPANTPLMLLREVEGDHRLVPIYIGHPEASAIQLAVEEVAAPRPLTHDLFVDTLERLGYTLTEVVITEVRDHTFMAELHIEPTSSDGAPAPTVVVSSRPSDAIALALRTGASIFASDELLDEVGQIEPTDEAEDASEIIDEFKDFIDHVSPDDFAGE